MLDPEHVAFRISDRNLWLVAHAFERCFASQSRRRVTLAASPGQTFTGRVTYIGRQVEAASRTIRVRI